MGIMMQAFYWDCPNESYQKNIIDENGKSITIEKDRQGDWWNFIGTKIDELAGLGIDKLWLPPAQKNSQWKSMGYDPFDYYDLGEFDQKGKIETWFGKKAELMNLIATAREKGIGCLADLVINQNNGGQAEDNAYLTDDYLIREYGINGNEKATWTKFEPVSGRFKRNFHHFYPCEFGERDEGRFGRLPDLCHSHPYVYNEVLEYAKFLNEEIGFEGFRYDMVKGYGSWMILAIQKHRKCFSVGEYWDSEVNIENWLYDVKYTCNVFDFPLRDTLKDICYKENLLSLADLRTVSDIYPNKSVTFVENHDTDKENDKKIVPNKMWAYSYILTHEGYPCIFWKDFYNYGLAKFGTGFGIARLMEIYNRYANGPTNILFKPSNDNPHYYAMERVPSGEYSGGLVYCLNSSDEWGQIEVNISWADTKLIAEAWDGTEEQPSDQYSNGEGKVTLLIPPKGYCVYIPQ